MKRLILTLLTMLPLLAHADGIADFAGAQWIGATTDANDTLADRSIILSKEVYCPWKNKRSTIYICGLGAYELYIDGQKVNPSEVLAPAWSDYRKTVFYNVIDVSRYITKGTHLIEVLLGNSFYHERGARYHKLKSNYGATTLLFKLNIAKSNDLARSVVSDTTWRWRLSPITYNSIYGGEDYDARLQSHASGSDRNAVVQTPPTGTLRSQLSAPIKIMEQYGVAKKLYDKTSTDGKRTMVFDMGQNLAGFPEITVSGKRGQSIKLTVGESLRKDGLVSQKQTGSPHYYIYILRGDGSERWHPRFSYYSFRYIQAECDDDVELSDLKSDFIYNSGADSSRSATFECSNPLFNATYRLIDNAVKSNWMSVWTDCPAREKLGWLEQDWLNGVGLLTNYDAKAMIEQEMQVIGDAQHPDGSMPEIAPEYIKFEGSWAQPFQESPEWGGALVALPYLYKQFYGDDKFVKQYLPLMRRYANYLATRDSAYILSMGLGDWYDYGPWRAGFSRNTPLALVSTAHYYLWTKLAGYTERADSIKRAFVSNFTPNSQAGLAIALDLGLYAEGQEQTLLDSLIAVIHSHGDRLTTGDIGTRYLFKVLIDHGQEDLLYKMLNHTDVPGYGAQLAKGMTTLTEQWNPDQGASRNHFMLGDINNHLVPDIGGIHVENGQARIAPLPMGDMTWCNVSAVIGEQRIYVSWKIENGNLNLTVTAPDEKKISIDYEKINNMCARRNLRLQYQFTSAK